MKNPGHKRSISGFSQPSQSKYSQNSLLNTMIRVNKIGGVASNLDSSSLLNGNRPSISPYRKNSGSRETTPKTVISRNSTNTGNSVKVNLNNNNNNFGKQKFVSKTPPVQTKRIQSSNNFVYKNLNQNNLLNSVSSLRNQGRNQLLSSFANNSQSSFHKTNNLNNNSRSNNSRSNNNSNNNSMSGGNISLNSKNMFSKINNNKKNFNSISQNNFHSKSLMQNIYNNNNVSSSRQIQTNHLKNLGGLENSSNITGNRSNRGNNLIKPGTKIVINNENLNQKKFERNLIKGKNPNNSGKTINNDYSNSPINNSFEKSSTSSFNSAYDRIKVNKSQMNNNNVSNNRNNNNNSNNSTNNNISNNNTNNDVLSSLLNSKNNSKSPKRKSPSPTLIQKNNNILNMNYNNDYLNKSPQNNLNILGKPGLNSNLNNINMNTNLGSTNFSSLGSSNDFLTKVNNMNSLSKKNFEISQKQNREKSKTPSPNPISTSLNNLNILNNLKMNKNLLSKNLNVNANKTGFSNNFSMKKINGIGMNNSNNTIHVNKMNNISNNNLNNKNKQSEVRGTIMEMNSDEFLNKITGKFGGMTRESFNSGNNNSNMNNTISRSNSNNNSHNNSNNNFKKEEINFNGNSNFNNLNDNINNPMGMSSGNFNYGNNDNINNNKFNNNNSSRDNKFMNNNNLNVNQGGKENMNNNNNIFDNLTNNKGIQNPNHNYNGNNIFNNNLNKNHNITKDILNNLNLRNMQANHSNMNTFKEVNTSPFIRKNNVNEKNTNDKKINPNNANINRPNTNTINNKNPDLNTIGETRNLTPNPTKINKSSNPNLNENRISKESPMKTNKSVDNIIVPPKKLRKRILYMSDISKIGFSGQNNKKFNQDNFFIYKNFNNDPNSIYMSVCDGHGVHGHDVSGYLKENLPVNLSKNFLKRNINLNTMSVSDPNLQGLIKETFINTNNQMNIDLRIDTNFSGSTCVSLIYTPTKLTTINVGDSRAVLGRLVNGVWKSHDLSNDHKPSEPNEAARIKKCGGRIEPYSDENNEFIGPPRVWLKEEDIPGLAMTRSFGDKIANIVGVTCEPEITEWELTPEDKFFIIASDGVWEFIESEECVNIIKDYYLKSDHKGACEHILKESSKRWMKEEEVIDDITMIIVFLE